MSKNNFKCEKNSKKKEMNEHLCDWGGSWSPASLPCQTGCWLEADCSVLVVGKYCCCLTTKPTNYLSDFQHQDRNSGEQNTDSWVKTLTCWIMIQNTQTNSGRNQRLFIKVNTLPGSWEASSSCWADVPADSGSAAVSADDTTPGLGR